MRAGSGPGPYLDSTERMLLGKEPIRSGASSASQPVQHKQDSLTPRSPDSQSWARCSPAATLCGVSLKDSACILHTRKQAQGQGPHKRTGVTLFLLLPFVYFPNSVLCL